MDIYGLIRKAVEENRQLIYDTQNYIWANAETGFREVKTSKYLENAFTKLGYELVLAGDIPGFYTVLDTGKPGPKILIFGEMDSLICPDHPDSDKVTGAVHCCGHSAQCAGLVGIAAALKTPEIFDKLCGKIMLCAVPAEELIEVEYRQTLREKGIIQFLGGKAEFMRRGYFDDVDLSFMVHTTTSKEFKAVTGAIGCYAKKIIYKGKAAHAGGCPWDGVNALYAATQGLNAVNAIRETFQEPDYIRFHPIITAGGVAVNAIPDTVCIETFVRGSSFDAIFATQKKVDRALCGAAISLGANVDIQDIPGYAPFLNCQELITAAGKALSSVLPGQKLNETGKLNTGSTDMGDMACVMPIIHPYAPGAVGTDHGKDYYIKNIETACVQSAEWQLALLYDLLKDGGKLAYDIKNNYKAPFGSVKEYVEFLEGGFKSGERITYDGDKATAKIF